MNEVLQDELKKIFGNNIYAEVQRHKDNGEKLFEKFLLKSAKPHLIFRLPKVVC